MKLDHVILLTRRLEELAAAFERAGFALTPTGEHGERFGTANRCMMFDDHYVELLGLRTDTPDNAPLRALYEQSAAVSMTSLQSEDVEATRRELQGRGIGTPDPIHFAREMGDAASEGKRVEFAVLLLPPSAELPTFFTMHKTPEVLYSQQWRMHPNGARRLLTAEVEVHDPKAAAAAYARAGAATRDERERSVVLQSAPQIVLSPIGSMGQRPAEGATKLARLRVSVSDLEQTRKVLEAGGVAYHSEQGELTIDCAAERHCLVSFTKS